ncbi:MAG: hypothetical protein M3324_02550 [Actinomycetota bacterium]|nr:hypothetical protein [Actinomycetota bacterium]
MMQQEFDTFFAASAGASAALIGLLFVAVSRAEPGSVFGNEARADRHAAAAGAFTGLADAFFVSLGALIPGANIGGIVLVVGAVALLGTLGLGRELWRNRFEGGRAGRGALLVLGGFVVYVLQLWYALSLLRAPSDKDYLSALAFLLLGSYVVGLGRAWELLGAPQKGILAWLLSPREQGDAGRKAERGHSKD